MTTNILEMRGITKTFPGVKALSDVTLEVARGEVHAICGENGAGKSTLMKVLSGVYPHGTYEGDIVFEDETVQFSDIRDSEAKGIVIIHQELALSPYLSIAENIFLNNEVKARVGLIDWNKTNHEAAKLLARVGLSENPTTKIMNIGVGKQQLVEIAKALSKRVKLLILDEPTAALNDEDSDHLLDLILHLKEQGITSIIISHKLNEIKKVADTVTVIRDGKTIETIAKADVTEERIIKDMVGRDLEHRYPDHTPNIGEEILRVEDWTAHHPQDPTRVMVDNVNLNVRAGEIVGIAGLMGAGRTEFAMSLFGQSYGIAHLRQGLQARQGDQDPHRVRGDRERHRLRHRGPQAPTGSTSSRTSSATSRWPRSSKLREVRPRQRQRGVQGRQRVPQDDEHQGAERAREDRQALRRQPAEGRALEVDLLRP